MLWKKPKKMDTLFFTLYNIWKKNRFSFIQQPTAVCSSFAFAVHDEVKANKQRIEWDVLNSDIEHIRHSISLIHAACYTQPYTQYPHTQPHTQNFFEKFVHFNWYEQQIQLNLLHELNYILYARKYFVQPNRNDFNLYG